MPTRYANIHPADVRAMVKKAGGTWRSLASRYGISETTVCAACMRPQPSGNRAIADFLGTTVHALWPEWFNADGTRRLSHTSHGSDSTARGHRQKAEAA